MSFNKVDIQQGNFGYQFGSPQTNAIIVLQEWWGIDEVIKLHAKAIHQKTGLQVFIPDLYKGKIGVDAEEAHHLMEALDFPSAVKEITETVQYLKKNGAKKVGVVGFCMGGALTFAAAEHSGIMAAAPFYGTPPEAICNLGNIKVPILAQFGKLDPMKGFADEETAKSAEKKVTANNKDAKFYIYEDAGHAYMNATFPNGVEKLKAIQNPIPSQKTLDDSWSRLVDFFKQNVA